MKEIDPITLEIMRNAFQSTADEMTAALVRTAYSTNIKDRRDCSCALLTKEGEVVAEPADVIFERMVIFTAKLRLEVEDVELAVYEIRFLVEDCGGFVAGMSTSKSEWGVMTLRVPQDEFYDVIEALEALGEVEEMELKGEDITATEAVF